MRVPVGSLVTAAILSLTPVATATAQSVHTNPYSRAWVSTGSRVFQEALTLCERRDTTGSPGGTSLSQVSCGANGSVTSQQGNTWNAGPFSAGALGTSNVGSISANASLAGHIADNTTAATQGLGAFNQILQLTDPFNISRIVVESAVSGSSRGAVDGDEYVTASSYTQLVLLGLNGLGDFTWDWEGFADRHLDGSPATLSTTVFVADAPTYNYTYGIHSSAQVFLGAGGNAGGSDVDLFAEVTMGLATVRVYDLQGNERFDGFTLTGPVNAVPEPATMTLLATGLAGIAAARRRRKTPRESQL